MRRALLCALAVVAGFGPATSVTAQDVASLRNAAGLQLLVATEDTQPRLRIILPGLPVTDRSVEVLFPEHVTAVRQGTGAAEQLYMFRPGAQGQAPRWRQTGQSLEYQRDLRGDIHMLARATLRDDGVRLRYEFTNRSSVAYSMIVAVTDPRLTGMFYDARLERTYVHHADGFDLLASETPSRLTMPLNQWLPARYLASFTWPVPTQRVEHRTDGITYYNKSRAVDVPFVATLSTDKASVIASFTADAGNVWSNPELTCQHVDPQASLAPGQRVAVEVQMVIIKGTLDDALRLARGQAAAAVIQRHLDAG